MLKILQARLQQYVNRELPDVQAGFRKGRGTRDQIANIRWIIEKAREFQKNIYFCFTGYAKAFDCVDHKKMWNILKEMGIPNHLTCLLGNMYAEEESALIQIKLLISGILLQLAYLEEMIGGLLLKDLLKKKAVSRKTSISALLTMPKPLTVWLMINWKILKEMGIPNHLICLLRNLYAGQKATIRPGHGTTDWFQIGKGVHQGCILSPVYLTYMQSTS